MFRRLSFFFLYAAMLAALIALGRHGEYLTILLSPIYVLFLMLFLLPPYRGLAVPGFILFALYIAYKWSASQMHDHWFFLQGTSVSLTALTLYILRSYWTYDFSVMRARTTETQSTVAGLVEAEQRSLAERERLEHEVGEIVGLFELAREFNDCIDLKEIIRVLSKQVFNHIPFERGKLVFLDDEIVSIAADEARILGSGKSEVADEATVDEMTFDHEIVGKLAKRQVPTRFDSEADDREKLFSSRRATYPVWIFPLVVSGEVTAAFWVEGARVEDFSKFEIIASQLALHVKKVKLYNRVRELSIVDGLTKLFVRRHFMERFHEELARSIKYGLSLVVILLDIDHFKQYNDTYGHLVGDVALRQVAQTIKEVVRRVDVAGRIGGEEFAVVLPETDLQGGLDCAERIRSKVAKRVFRAYDEDTRLTVSIGLTVFPVDFPGGFREGAAGEDPVSVLLHQADKALYRAKEEGRNQVVAFGAPRA